METLPIELKWRIALFSDYSSLKKLCETSKEFSTICNEYDFWKEKIFLDFPNIKKHHKDTYEETNLQQFFNIDVSVKELKNIYITLLSKTLLNIIKFITDIFDMEDLPHLGYRTTTYPSLMSNLYDHLLFGEKYIKELPYLLSQAKISSLDTLITSIDNDSINNFYTSLYSVLKEKYFNLTFPINLITIKTEYNETFNIIGNPITVRSFIDQLYSFVEKDSEAFTFILKNLSFYSMKLYIEYYDESKYDQPSPSFYEREYYGRYF